MDKESRSMVHAWIPRRSQRAGHRRALAREKSISRETGLTYKPHTGSGHSAPAQSRIQIGGILNWVNVRIYYASPELVEKDRRCALVRECEPNSR